MYYFYFSVIWTLVWSLLLRRHTILMRSGFKSPVSQNKKKVTWSQQTVLKHSIEQYALHMWQSESGLSRAVCQWFNNGVSRSDWCRLNRLHAGEPWRDPRFREFATWSPIRMALELKQTFFASYFCSYFLYYYFLVFFFWEYSTNLVSVFRNAEFLSAYQIENNSISILPRGLINRSNYCYINAILQALVACPPFYHLMRAIRSLPAARNSKHQKPFIDAM